MAELKLLKHERPESLEAFNYYFKLGNKRSYVKTARKFDRTVQTIYKWSKSFNWRDRVRERDLRVAKGVEKKCDNYIINTKEKYRKEIDENLKVFKALIATAIQKDKNGKSVLNIKINNPKDAVAVINAYEKLVKLDLLLLGEATERSGDEITVTLSE